MMPQRVVSFALNALAWVMLIGLMAGCVQQQPSPSALADQLNHCLIRVNSLPAGWTKANGPERFYPEPRVLPGRAAAGQIIEFVHDSSRANASHLVLLYPSEAKAADEYVGREADDFDTAARVTPWQEPSLPGYRHQGANEERLACAEFEGAGHFTDCRISARYGRYLSSFSTWLGPGYMSLEDLARVLKAVDERMSACSAQ
jgi:hypothetical protein